jgi:hypothetical protein
MTNMIDERVLAALDEVIAATYVAHSVDHLPADEAFERLNDLGVAEVYPVEELPVGLREWARRIPGLLVSFPTPGDASLNVLTYSCFPPRFEPPVFQILGPYQWDSDDEAIKLNCWHRPKSEWPIVDVVPSLKYRALCIRNSTFNGVGYSFCDVVLQGVDMSGLGFIGIDRLESHGSYRQYAANGGYNFLPELELVTKFFGSLGLSVGDKALREIGLEELASD